MRHATDNMQRTTRNIQTPAIPFVADDAQPTPCSAQRRAARRGYKLPSCKRRHAIGNPHLPHTKTNPRKKGATMIPPQQCRRVCGALAEIRFERKRTNERMHAIIIYKLAQYGRIVVQALAPPCRPSCTARGRTSACNTKPDRRLSGRRAAVQGEAGSATGRRMPLGINALGLTYKLGGGGGGGGPGRARPRR